MLTSFRIITEAPKAWSYLNGIVALYKPSGLSTSRVQSTIIGNICRGCCFLLGNHMRILRIISLYIIYCTNFKLYLYY